MIHDLRLGNHKRRKPIVYEEVDCIYPGLGKCHIVTSHYKDKNGYVRVRIDGKFEFIHRAIYENGHGKIPKGMIVRHKCDTPQCCNLSHLEIGTHLDNVRDKIERGRHAKGVTHGNNKFSEERMVAVKKDTRKYDDIAEAYGMSRQHVAEIKNNKQWKHLGTEVLKGDNQVRGKAQYNAKLTEDKVRKIRQDKRPTLQVAKEYGVSRKLIDNVRQLKNWRHVT